MTQGDSGDQHRVRIGTSGWNYEDWSPELYPEGLPKAKRRDVYAAQFDTVELNASFYRWPAQHSFQLWHDALPSGFAMTVKAPRGLTHASKLRSVEKWRPILERDWGVLGDKAGIFLVQLAPSHSFEPDILDSFLGQLPASMDGRVAVEFRHDSWQNDWTQQILRDHNAAYVVMSGAKLPCNLWATASFVYVRFHGPDSRHLYSGEYSEQDMNWWADRAREWLGQGRQFWGYFNNDYHANAVRNARRLRELLG